MHAPPIFEQRRHPPLYRYVPMTAADYAEAGATVPERLAAALMTQLGESPAEYLAQGDAATEGQEVVASLESAGVRITGTSISGTDFTVYAATDTDAEAAKAAGFGSVVVGSPPVPPPGIGQRARPVDAGGEDCAADLADLAEESTAVHVTNCTHLSGGWGFYFDGREPVAGRRPDIGASASALCSVGFNGFMSRDPRTTAFVTAGHCGDGLHSAILSPDGTVTANSDTTPNIEAAGDSTLGAFLSSTFKFGGDKDSGLVSVTAPTAVSSAEVTTYGGGHGYAAAGTDVPVFGAQPATVGESVCHSGMASGWQCGRVYYADTKIGYQAGSTDSSGALLTVKINVFADSACTIPGDSGGPVMAGNWAIGIASLSDFAGDPSAHDCNSAFLARNNAALASGRRADGGNVGGRGDYVDYSFSYPVLAAGGGPNGVIGQQTGWTLGLHVPAPKVTSAVSGSTCLNAHRSSPCGIAVSVPRDFTDGAYSAVGVFLTARADDGSWSALSQDGGKYTESGSNATFTVLFPGGVDLTKPFTVYVAAYVDDSYNSADSPVYLAGPSLKFSCSGGLSSCLAPAVAPLVGSVAVLNGSIAREGLALTPDVREWPPGTKFQYAWYDVAADPINNPRLYQVDDFPAAFWKSGSLLGTGHTLIVPDSARGHQIVLETTATIPRDAVPVVMDSPPTRTVLARAAIAPGTVTAVGQARSGGRLSAQTRYWTNRPAFTYQWLNDGTAIRGATSSSYIVRSSQIGHDIEVRVTGRAPGLTSASVTSSNKAKVVSVLLPLEIY